MMKHYLKNITPDSLSGYIFALEGMQGGIVLLNGPTGCKFYHSATSDYQTMKQLAFDTLNYPESWFFGQSRVPCTYLDARDYVYGSRDKIEEALLFISNEMQFDFLAVVNSPGAALIGDDIKGIVKSVLPEIPCVVIESPGFSENICEGYDRGAVEIISQLCGESNRDREASSLSVNLLGMSIFERNHEGDFKEIKRMLALCGIKVNCVLFDGCSLSELRSLNRAALNVVIHPEYAKKTADFLKEQYSIPAYVAAPPIGFYAVEKMASEICALIGASAERLLIESEKSRARAYIYMSRFNSLTGLPKGSTFGIEGNWATAYAYTLFLWKYFGLVLKGVAILNEECTPWKAEFLQLVEKCRCESALQNRELRECEMVFANGNTISKLKLEGENFIGIENGLPSLGYVDVIAKTHMGLHGALFLVEQIINGLAMK